MKESKKRDTFTAKKKNHPNVLESWDQSDLEDADEKVLEKRLLQLKMQLKMAQDDGSHDSSRHRPSKYKRKYGSEDLISSDSDSSDAASDSSISSSSSLYKRTSRGKRKLKDSTSVRRDDKHNKDDYVSSKSDKKLAYKKHMSPVSDKYSRKLSPIIDKREVYNNRTDATNRSWGEKSKDYAKDREKRESDYDRSRMGGGRSRTERNRSSSASRERASFRSREDSISNKKTALRTGSGYSVRRKDSPEPTRNRRSPYDSVGHSRGSLSSRKLSPKDERMSRRDDRRVDLKTARRSDGRSDFRVSRDVRDRKDLNSRGSLDRNRERSSGVEVNKGHRDIADHSGSDFRDRNRTNDDRFKDRDKRIHDRLENDRNTTLRSTRPDSRDCTEDKFRRADPGRVGGVFDRMRSRYNDRRNAIDSRRSPVKDKISDVKRDRTSLDRDQTARMKNSSVETNGADKLTRDKRATSSTSRRSPRSPKSPIHRDRRDCDRSSAVRVTANATTASPIFTANVDKSSHSPITCDRRFPNSPVCRKAYDSDNRFAVRRKSVENDNSLWSKKKMLIEGRSRSRSSERRRRRRSSQEEWRVIDMTSPLLDDDLSADDNLKSKLLDVNAQTTLNKSNRSVGSRSSLTSKDNLSNQRNKSMLTDELSDISDEDFNDVVGSTCNITTVNNSIKSIKESDSMLGFTPIDCVPVDEISRKTEHKPLLSHENLDANKDAVRKSDNSLNVVDLMIDRKLPGVGETAENLDFGRNSEDIDSEDETVSRVSDALGVDWADLVEEYKKRLPVTDDGVSSIRRQWSANNILSRIGISQRYAGEELYNEIQKRISEDADCPFPESSKLSAKEDLSNVTTKDKFARRKISIEPYRTAISARKDISMRRRLCGLPVKNLCNQQTIGICHWIV